MSEHIDPLTLARFMVLPGASALVEAFAAIPDSMLRQTCVAHVSAIAQAFTAAPAYTRPPDPLMALAPDPVKALTGPRRGEPATDDPQVAAVQHMMRGVPPAEAARLVEIPVRDVLAAKKKARAAGMVFPTVKMGKHTPQGAKRPYQPAKVGFITTQAELKASGGAANGAMTKAAKVRGISVEAYLARRKTALEMALAGRPLRDIIAATGEAQLILQQWWTMARNAGHAIPYMTLAPPHVEAVVEPDGEPAPTTADVIDFHKPNRKADDPHKGRFVLYSHELDHTTMASVGKGASMMGLSVEEFLTKRRFALECYREGMSVRATAAKVGVSKKQAENWRGRAQRAGVLSLTDIGARRAENLANRTPS